MLSSSRGEQNECTQMHTHVMMQGGKLASDDEEIVLRPFAEPICIREQVPVVS